MAPQLPPPVQSCPDLLFIAGEHSGDQHGAKVIADLLTRRADLNLVAIGGPEMKAAGAQLLFDLTRHSVVGLVEVARHYDFFKGLFESAVSWISEFAPRQVCMIDYPGFNLRLAARLKREGISAKGGGSTKVLYYIGPQIWAWNRRRRFRMAETLDGLAVIFPFEIPYYVDTSLQATFVGHPFARQGHELPVRYSPSGPLLLLPGSRRAAVRRIYPSMLGAYERLLGEFPDLQAVTLFPSEEIRGVLESTLQRFPRAMRALSLQAIGTGASGRAAITSSGTISLACSLSGIPGCIAYRAHPVTYWIGRALVRVGSLGIANLLLERPVYREFIQGRASPGRLSDELKRILNSPESGMQAQDNAQSLLSCLHQPQAPSPADWLLEQMDA